MTETVEPLKAGREMDALVAEKVMGWRSDPGWLTATRHIQPYSTDIASAFRIFDRFLIVCLLKDAQTTPSEPFLGQAFDGKQAHYARAANPALALCRAALAAVEAGE